MPRFVVELAGCRMEISTQHDFTQRYCRDFLVEADFADFVIAPSAEDIEAERDAARRNDLRAGIEPRAFSDEHLESLAVLRKVAEAMLSRDTILIHGSVVKVDGRAFLFTAPSGTGKSTHARLWKDLLGDRLTYINDDKPLVSASSTGDAVAFGTPWNGKHRLSTNDSAPLAAIVLLEQAPVDWVKPLSSEDAYASILAAAHRPDAPAQLAHTMELVARLAENVPIFALGCTPTLHAAKTCFEAIFPNANATLAPKPGSAV